MQVRQCKVSTVSDRYHWWKCELSSRSVAWSRFAGQYATKELIEKFRFEIDGVSPMVEATDRRRRRDSCGPDRWQVTHGRQTLGNSRSRIGNTFRVEKPMPWKISESNEVNGKAEQLSLNEWTNEDGSQENYDILLRSYCDVVWIYSPAAICMRMLSLMSVHFSASPTSTHIFSCDGGRKDHEWLPSRECLEESERLLLETQRWVPGSFYSSKIAFLQASRRY